MFLSCAHTQGNEVNRTLAELVGKRPGGNGGGGSGSAQPDKCHYRCQESGGCTVRISSQKPVNGNTMGSCFSELFGGKCTGIPEACEACSAKCKGREGDTFPLEAS